MRIDPHLRQAQEVGIAQSVVLQASGRADGRQLRRELFIGTEHPLVTGDVVPS